MVELRPVGSFCAFDADIFWGHQIGGQNVFLGNYSSGYRYLGDGGTDRREILHDAWYISIPDSLHFWGRYPQGNPNIPNFGPLKTEYLQNGKWQR